MKIPNSTYVYLTFGSGLAMGRLRIDVGAAVGRERGSGDGLSARRVAMTLSYDLGSNQP
jgi:hypothetical protein